MSARGYGAGGQRPTSLPPGAAAGQILTPPCVPFYVGPAVKAAAEWWFGQIPGSEFRVNTGDQGTFTATHQGSGEFTDHTRVVPARVRAATGARVVSTALTQTGALPGGATAGDLAVLLVGWRTPVAVTGPGWTTAATMSGTTDTDRWGWGAVAWRVLTVADITAGEVSWDTNGADATATPDGAWALAVVEGGTFDPEYPITATGVETARYSSSGSYAFGLSPASPYTVPADALGLIMSCHQGTTATVAGVFTDEDLHVIDYVSSPSGALVASLSPFTVTDWATVEYAPSTVTSAVAAIVLVNPAVVALGGLSGGGGLWFETRSYRQLNIPADTTEFETDIDVTGEPVDPVSGAASTRFAYAPDDDGDLTVTAVSSYTGSSVDVIVLDSSGTQVATGTDTVTVEVTGGDTYTVIIAPAYPSAGVRVTATGPRHEGALPTAFPATAAPAVPALDPYAGEPVLWRRSPTVPAPTLVDGRPTDWQATSWTEEAWGTFRVIVDGVDVTRFRDHPVTINRYELMEPFGCGPAQVTFDQIGPWEARTGDLAWLAIGADVDIVRLHPDGETTTVLWSGVVPSEGIKAGPGGRSTTLTLIGDMWVADLQVHKARPYLPPTDLGSVIASALNTEVISRRVAKIPKVTTGITCNKRGSSDQTVLGYVQELIGIYGTVEDGTDSWTITRVTGTPRAYQLALKDLDAAAVCTIRAGALWDIDLVRDATETPNVIFGSGVNRDGYAWAGWVYPKASSDTYRAYPLPTSPLQVITLGTSDGDTITDTGVSDLQERLNDLGIRGVQVTVDGVYSSADAADVRVVQDHYGLLVDGIVGPQTWAAVFPQYLTDTLDGAYRLPLAIRSAVKPRGWYSDGTDAGANPNYDPDVLRVEVDRKYEAGITKGQARVSAKAELAKAPTPGLLGTITLQVDPPQCSKWDLREGTRVTVQGIRGSSKTLHVCGVSVQPPTSATDPGTVTLTVDEYARDLLTVAAIRARDVGSRQDPVRLPSRKLRRSKVESDAAVPFDGESAGGIIRRTALIGGLWVYVDVPVSQSGRVARVELTTSPATKFTVAFFGDTTVTPQQLIKFVGANPLAESKSGYGPYDRLDYYYPGLGFIQGIGGPGQAAGYDPGYEDSPYNPGNSTPLTGMLRSKASWEYSSSRPPFLRVFFWAPSSCSIVGRIWPAPMEA